MSTAGFASTIFPSLLVRMMPSVANSNSAFSCRSSDSIVRYKRFTYMTAMVVMATITAGKRCCSTTCHLDRLSLGKKDSNTISTKLRMPNSSVYESSFMKTVSSTAATRPPSKKPCEGFRNCNTTVDMVSMEQNNTIMNFLSLNILQSFYKSTVIIGVIIFHFHIGCSNLPKVNNSPYSDL